MDIQKEKEAFEAWYCRNHTGLKQSDLAKFRTLSGYSFSDSLKINISWEAWQAAKAQAVPEGFVEKTESNTRHYFKLKDWDEWTCIDGIKDAITSDHDINAIVEVECLEVIEINNKPCFALLAFGKRHGTEVKFFDAEEEAIEAQEPTND